MYSYLREGLEDQYGILELQNGLLELMVYLDEFCSQYHIEYCLTGGSALGARRHGGFIPWDDDIDIYMTPEQYESFRAAFVAHGDQNLYYLQEWCPMDIGGHHVVTMAKLRRNDSELLEADFDGWDIHQGLFVDIFIVTPSPDRLLPRLAQYIWAEAVVAKGLSMRNYRPHNRRDAVLMKLARLLPAKWLIPTGLKQVYRYIGQNTPYLCGFLGTAKYSEGLYPTKALFPAVEADFETVRLKVPAENDVYLATQYGPSFLELPPVEDRPINKHAANWHVSAPGKYTAGQHYSDEWKLV